MESGNWCVIGVDPAPSKSTVICQGDDIFHAVSPRALREHIAQIVGKNDDVLVAWDAPLSFDPRDFYDRTIDKAARKWAASMVEQGKLAPKAVNARSFAGLPHWAISCHAIGHPFTNGFDNLNLVDAPRPGKSLIEVHPAVAIAAWWIKSGQTTPLERYKGKPEVAKSISNALGFPKRAGDSDDHLDAYIAYKLGVDFLEGTASLAGCLKGGYVLPNGAANVAIQSEFLNLSRAEHAKSGS